jgi:predicted dehydrogenase
VGFRFVDDEDVGLTDRLVGSTDEAGAATSTVVRGSRSPVQVTEYREFAASAVFFTRRFMPQLQEFIEQAGRTGGWVEARVDHIGSIYEEGNPFGASPWRRESGGLWDVGPHAVALVLPVLGPVTEVTAMVGPRDMTHLLLRHASEAISTLALSLDAPPAAGREEAVFAGKAGVVAVPAVPWEPVLAFGRMLDELIAAADGGPQPQLDVRFGVGVTAVLAAAEEAARTGRTVRLAA